MIVLKLEMHSARSGQVYSLGQAIIANDGTSDDPKRGSYRSMVFHKRVKDTCPDALERKDILREGRVENYPRLSYNVWRLVIRALLAAFPEEKAK